MGDRDTDNKSTERGLSSHSSQAPLPAPVASEPVLPTTYPICELPVCVREARCPHFADEEAGVHRRLVAQGVRGPAETVPASCASPRTRPCWPVPKPSCVFSSHGPPPWGRDRLGPCLLLLGRQGTAREVTHPRSPRGTQAGPGEQQGFRALPTWPIQLPLPEPGFSFLSSESG